jgi:hypothetical protein
MGRGGAWPDLTSFIVKQVRQRALGESGQGWEMVPQACLDFSVVFASLTEHSIWGGEGRALVFFHHHAGPPASFGRV